MRIVSKKLEAENSWVLEKQQVDTILVCNVNVSLAYDHMYIIVSTSQGLLLIIIPSLKY